MPLIVDRCINFPIKKSSFIDYCVHNTGSKSLPIAKFIFPEGKFRKGFHTGDLTSKI